MLLADTEGMMDIREFVGVLKAGFDFYEVYGQREWGEVFITSYYTPVIGGSTIPTPRFSQPLYGVPHDLVWVDLASFARRFPEMMPWQGLPNEQKTKPGILRGRLCPCPEKGCVPEVAPYYSRKEIDEERRLADQGLELAWLDPIDCFFLQIQGSGVVNLENGMRLRVGYAAQNGHPYVAIGKFMYDVIPPQKMSMQAIRRHLKTLSPDELQEMLNRNPSYVFFRTLPGDPVTYFGTEVVDGRTIATDTRFFPKGALAYLEFEKPDFPDMMISTCVGRANGPDVTRLAFLPLGSDIHTVVCRAEARKIRAAFLSCRCSIHPFMPGAEVGVDLHTDLAAGYKS